MKITQQYEGTRLQEWRHMKTSGVSQMRRVTSSGESVSNSRKHKKLPRCRILYKERTGSQKPEGIYRMYGPLTIGYSVRFIHSLELMCDTKRAKRSLSIYIKSTQVVANIPGTFSRNIFYEKVS